MEKENKKFCTFTLKPSIKELLKTMSENKGISQSQFLEDIIKEKANRLNCGVEK